jgi:hypothetical protein
MVSEKERKEKARALVAALAEKKTTAEKHYEVGVASPDRIKQLLEEIQVPPLKAIKDKKQN